MKKRASALSLIENKIEWKVFNPVFDLNTPQFDEAFSSEYNLDSRYYLEHSNGNSSETFEDKMCKNIFTGHGNPDSKIYILKGDLGAGKTSFVRYMGKIKLPSIYKKYFFFI